MRRLLVAEPSLEVAVNDAVHSVHSPSILVLLMYTKSGLRSHSCFSVWIIRYSNLVRSYMPSTHSHLMPHLAMSSSGTLFLPSWKHASANLLNLGALMM